MKKIIIIGSGGAGKSTLAKQLGQKLSIDVVHLDQLLWRSNWEMTDKEYQINSQKAIVNKPMWIIDGNFNSTLKLRISAADTIIFLDINRYGCIYQVLKRIKKYHGTTRPDMHNNCPEKFDFTFIKWLWGFPKKQRPAIIDLLNKTAKDKQIIVLKNNKQIRWFIDSL